MNLEQIKALVACLTPFERAQLANCLVEYATYEDALATRLWDLRNGTEQHM